MVTHDSRTAVIAALIGNVLVAVTKWAAAVLTGSSAMMSEAIHSSSDTINEVLLLYGQHRASKRPDEKHPLGYGRELYFWSFVVALLIFALGAGLSIYEGYGHILQPQEISRPWISYAVLGVSMLFEVGSWWFGWKTFQKARGESGIWQAITTSRDPPTFMVLFEDSAAIVGIIIAVAGTWLSIHLAKPWIDGAASIAIGVLLALVAVLLARETKDLLIGLPAQPELSQALRDCASKQPSVRKVVDVITSQLSPDQVIANLGVQLDDSLRVPEVEQLIQRIESDLKERFPQLFAVFVRPQEHERPEGAPGAIPDPLELEA